MHAETSQVSRERHEEIVDKAGISEKEQEVWSGASRVLGDELISKDMMREEFSKVIQTHVDQFVEGGLVREWLAAHLKQ
jgi:hypothetical protein